MLVRLSKTELTVSADASTPVIVARRPKASIAVLPFELAGQNDDAQHFAEGLAEDLAFGHSDRVIRSLVVKLKFADFEQTTAERAAHSLEPAVFEELAAEAWKRGKNRPVRLVGAGVRFEDPQENTQLELRITD